MGFRGGGGTRHEDNKSPHLTWIQIQNPEEEVMRITSDELKQGVDFEANFKQRKLLQAIVVLTVLQQSRRENALAIPGYT